jgi:SNF2 family DNA or RNA helicase
MLYSVRHPLANDKEWYEKHFCAKQQKTIGANSFWDVTGAAHLDELYYETQKGPHAAMILRTKEECLDLPPKIQVMRPVELSPKAQREFDHTLSELEKAYQERKENKRITLQQAIAKRLGELQEDYDEGQIDDEVLKEGMEEVGEMQSRLRNLDAADAVVMLGYICHAASLAKIEETKGFVEEIIGSGEQVGIFVRFRDVCHTLAGLFPNSETITSETPNAERQHIVDRFQAGQTRVIVCTFGAGGVGLTMTAASHAIMHDRPWTPGAVEQAEDRFHRIGSTKTVFSTWMQLPEADERIDDILQQKQERIDLALHGERKTMRGTKSVIAQAPMILDGIFSERKKR